MPRYLTTVCDMELDDWDDPGRHWHVYPDASVGDRDGLTGTVRDGAPAYCGAVPSESDSSKGVAAVKELRKHWYRKLTEGVDLGDNMCSECNRLFARGQVFDREWQDQFRTEHREVLG